MNQENGKSEKRVGMLRAPELRRACESGCLGFVSTDELSDPAHVFGQDRAINAIEFGADIAREGYNLFVLGEPGSGKRSLVRQLLEQRAAAEPPPSDWVYVYNFAKPHQPNAIELPTGQGVRFRDALAHMVEELRTAIPAIFDSEEYRVRRHAIDEKIQERQQAAFEVLEKRASEKSIRAVRTPAGITLVPLRDGELIKPEAFEALPEAERKQIEADIQELQRQMLQTFEQMPRLEKERRKSLRELNHEFANYAVREIIDEERAAFSEIAEVRDYLDLVQADIINNIQMFTQSQEMQEASELPGGGQQEGGDGMAQALLGNPFHRYEANLIVDNSRTRGAPVVEEGKPTVQQLVGRVEHIAQMGALVTNFMLIKPGALHRANGGYLLIDSRALLMQPFAWETLKRALWNRETRIESPADMLSMVSTISLEPEPIPLRTKVVLFGEAMTYYLLSAHDPEFQGLFKTVAEMETTVDWTPESEQAFACQLAAICRAGSVRHLDPSGVGRMVEQAARHASDAEKLSIHIGHVADLLREADYWANKAGAELISAAHVQKAVDMREERIGRIREKSQESITRDIVLIDTDGARIGQINGLSVLSIGDLSFGRPTRISARIGIGAGRVLDIEREVELGGPLHSKGVLILSGFLRERFGVASPLALTASLVFEQSYGGVDGDSASSAELYCLLSAIAEVPIQQSFAVTGSVNQHGEVQAIGGVNEKIEGFFDICVARGLTGRQGVLIPSANVKHLMLRQDVVDAVGGGRFHIHAIDTIDHGIEVLTGVTAGERQSDGSYPEGSINARVAARLANFSRARKSADGRASDTGERI
ncbi:MAG: ATP-binding protein [Alphaproteobacteria bacterium]|nr:ATP-binding protein [Alphaproteobacteria bacterium]